MMNKYQRALDELDDGFHNLNNNDVDKIVAVFKELVDKATPKKVVKWLNDRSMACCPICHSAEYAEEMPKHCRYCGQALDWSEND